MAKLDIAEKRLPQAWPNRLLNLVGRAVECTGVHAALQSRERVRVAVCRQQAGRLETAPTGYGKGITTRQWKESLPRPMASYW